MLYGMELKETLFFLQNRFLTVKAGFKLKVVFIGIHKHHTTQHLDKVGFYRCETWVYPAYLKHGSVILRMRKVGFREILY